MSILKSLFSGFLQENNDGDNSVNYNTPPQKKRTRDYGTPDYSVYVNIRPNDDIFIVSLTEQIKKKYKDIADQYELARKFYNEAFWRPVQVKDYRESFDALNRTFELLAIYFCKRKGFQVENKDVFELAVILGGRIFNNDQMNVVNGVLALIDKYEDNTMPVSDYDVKTHFISLGIMVKLFKEAVIGKNINNVPCTFEKMREKSATKQQRKEEKKELGRAAAKDPNLQAILGIEREYTRAKNYMKGYDNARVIASLNNTVLTSTRRICKLVGVSLKENSEQKDIKKLLDSLLVMQYVSKKYCDVANCVTDMYKAHPNGRGIPEAFLQEMIQLVGATIIPKLKAVSEQDTRRKKMLPDLEAPSFKSMEKGGGKDELANRYPDIPENMEKVNRLFEAGENKLALHSIRYVLEIIADNLCKKYNLDFEGKPTLQNQIDAIVNAANYTDAQRDIMHRARMFGNKGSHFDPNQKDVSASTVTAAIEVAKKCIGLFKEEMFGASGGSNSPKFDPDYYNNTRRYYGRWCRIFTRQELMLNLEYVKLERKAKTGDIEAMLDIASGFLSNKIEWDENSLIYAPKNKPYNDCTGVYDARYYHWILKACNEAYNQWVSGKTVPITYIATALVEGLKILCCYEIVEKEKNTQGFRNSLYSVAEKMFEEEMLAGTYFMMNMANMLICMFEEYGEGDENGSIVAPVHGKVTINSVKWYLYLYNKYNDKKEEVLLPPRLLFDEEDIGKTYAEVYEKYK